LSPKRLCQYMSMRHARGLLLEGQSTLFAANETGLSGNGRLHDLFVQIEAATPGEVKQRGRGLTITYGYHPTPLGVLMVAQTKRGLCYLGFVVGEDREEPLRRMKAYWSQAVFKEDTEATVQAAEKI